MASNIAKFETIRTLANASITALYVAVGTPFPNPLRAFRISNPTDGDMFFSTDGIKDEFFLPASAFVLYDIAGNSGISSNFRVAANTQFYCRYSTAPSKSAVYIEAIYQGE